MKLQPFIQHISQLGESIRKEWEQQQWNKDLFPELANRSLSAFEVGEVPELDQVLSDLPQTTLPTHTFIGNEFSDLSLTLFRTPEFCIDVYYWYKSDTIIHNHHFFGAFKVIAGRSFQIEYEFLADGPEKHKITMGKIKKKRHVELLVGAVETIDPDDAFIHHVFHIGKPTITLCVRVPAFKDRFLSVFVLQEFKINIAPPSVSTLRWVFASGLKLQLEPETKIDMPYSIEELIQLHLLQSMRYVNMYFKVLEQIEAHLKTDPLGELYLKRFAEQPQIERKIRALAGFES